MSSRITGPILLAILLTGIVRTPETNADEPTKILLIGKEPDHPHGTHMYMHVSGLLAKCLEKHPQVEPVVSLGWPKDSKVLADVKTIVLYSNPGAEYLMDGPGAGQFHEAMKNGTGLVTIHWASAVFEKDLDRLGDQWGDYLGGFWVSNYGLSTDTSHLKQLKPDHPICRGWAPYELHDEYYLKPTMKEATPLLQVTTKGEDVVVGWAHERADGGRAYGTTLGHFYRNFQIEAFRKTIVNAILWSAHVDVPKNGADVKLSEADLALPPKVTE